MSYYSLSVNGTVYVTGVPIDDLADLVTAIQHLGHVEVQHERGR